jgi:polysaccharide export outer membrane protein
MSIAEHRTPRPIASALRAGGFALLLFYSSAASAEYRLLPGDAVEISVAGLPELRQRAQISVDGAASLPLVGEVNLAGLTLEEARAKIQVLLPKGGLTRRTDDGREYPVIVSPGEITIVVAEYRPVYLNGDISKPGAQPFRPGMTVRQAVALAGGYDVARFRMNNPFMEQAELRGEYQSLWAEFAKTQALVARLRAELDGKQSFEQGDLTKTPIPATLANAIIANEQERMKVRGADYAKEKAYLDGAVKQEDQRAAVLGEQYRQEKEGTKVDQEDLQRVQELYQRGNMAVTRVSDARRSLLLSSTRALQTAVQLAQVERERGDLGRKLERLDDTRRLSLLSELQDANGKLAEIRAKLSAVGEKLTYAGLVRSQLVRGKGSAPEIIVYRTTSKGRQRIESNEDADLQPGDTIEVSLQGDLLPSSSAPPPHTD